MLPYDPARDELLLIEQFRIGAIHQTVYYVLNELEDLYGLAESDLHALIRKARALGPFEPTYPPKPKAA